MKKILNIFLTMAIILSNFIPFITMPVASAATCTYQVAISYSDKDVELSCHDTYASALVAMNAYESTAESVAVIKKNSIIINAKYAFGKMDVRNENVMRSSNESITRIYTTAAAAKTGSDNANASTYLTYILGTWGEDAAFIDYNATSDAVRIKISGVTGWVKKSEVKIIPISKFYNSNKNYLLTKATIPVNLRSGPSTNNAIISKCGSDGKSTCATTNGTKYEFYPQETVKQGGYTWYKVQYSSSIIGWVASEGTSWFVEELATPGIFKPNTYYLVKSNVLYHQIQKGVDYYNVEMNLGTAPFVYNSPETKTYYLKSGLKYYSFDGNYFYTDEIKMLTDYKAGTFDNSINKEHPHFAYFMYLPSRSRTGYSAASFNQAVYNVGYRSFPTDPKSYVNASTGAFIKNIGTASMMYGIGDSILAAEKEYGANGLTIYANAVRESGTGTSSIAFYKNNLFGMGASDAAPFKNAKTYATVEASVNDYAKTISSGTGYTSLDDYRYNGTHNGNKASGVKVQYASDPYAGESSTGVAYNLDKNYGGLDNFSNTLGIKIKSDLVKIYAEPSSTSRVIYETKNKANSRTLSNLSFIVTDKVYVTESGKRQGYYHIYTDVSLNSSRVYSNNVNYNFNYSYGYIKEEDLYVQNKQPEIVVSDFEVVQASTLNLKSKATASDYEDGNLTSKITVDGEVNTDVLGKYPVTYTVQDSNKYSISKTVNVTVIQTEAPIITASEIEIPQYTSFNPMTGVSASDKNDGNITSKVQIKISTIDTNTVGEYNVIYTVTNTQGLTTEKTRIVKVIANEKPVITAVNKTVYIGDTFNTLASVTAHDKEDGNVTSKITVSGTVDMTKAGEYVLTYKVTDSVGQLTEKKITITVEAKKFIQKDSLFNLEELQYNTSTKKLDFTGFLVIKGIDNKPSTAITYDIIFENQYDGDTIIKSLSRLTSKVPFAVPNDKGLDYSGAWFKESLAFSDINSGDYTVYIRARSGDYEAKALLKNDYFNPKVSAKFTDGSKNYQLRANYYNKNVPLEFYVRDNETLNTVNNPTIDNMFNQIYSISFTTDGKLNIMGTSHNVNGDYGTTASVTRKLMFENVASYNISKIEDVGSITNGPYKVSLKVSDGKDKTRAWYKSTIDITSLPKGTYSIILRTKTGAIDDTGEVYDLNFSNIASSVTYGGKKYSISRNDAKRYRIELTVE